LNLSFRTKVNLRVLYDLAIVGAGIVGLAHALAAAQIGKRVLVVERDAQANGASIRNFGFVTVSGQAAGNCWEMARRSRDVWAEVAQAADIPVLHRGLLVTARRPQSEAVIDAFLKTDMGEECRRLTGDEARAQCPALSPGVTAALLSPHELRVESREALPRLARWLAEAHGVEFMWQTHVHARSATGLETSRGAIEAEAVIICPGADATSLYPQRFEPFGITPCKLQMLRIQPKKPMTLGSAVMSDLGLARYHGYADLPQGRALGQLLDTEQAAQRANGVHLIAVQSADGSLVIGDSHHYGDTDPFSRADIDSLILEELDAVLDLGGYDVTERWTGIYPVAQGRWRLTDAPDATTRIVMVTAGCGASTGFAIGEETIAEMFG